MMALDSQTIINLTGGAILAAIGWFARQIWEAVNKLKEDIRRIEVDLPSHYVKKDDFGSSMKEIKEMLGKIFDKLDNKVDK